VTPARSIAPSTLTVDAAKLTAAERTRGSRLSFISISSAQDAQVMPSTASEHSATGPSTGAAAGGGAGGAASSWPTTLSSSASSAASGMRCGS